MHALWLTPSATQSDDRWAGRLTLQTAGRIDVEEEFYQSCFHITVYRSYAPPAAESPGTPPRRHRVNTTLLAARVH